MRSAGVGILLLLAIVTSGCATKKHFKHQVTPTINRSNDLDQQAAGNSGDVLTVNDVIGKNVDALTARILDVNQLSTGALRQAGAVQQEAVDLDALLNVLTNAILNLDNFEEVARVEVQFVAEGDQIDGHAAGTIDDFASKFDDAPGFLVTLKGNTDASGNKEYNYDLSKRRALAVAGYLASKFHIPPYRIFIVGLGPDKPVADNSTRSGRAKNRRVDVTLFRNFPPTQANEDSDERAAIK